MNALTELKKKKKKVLGQYIYIEYEGQSAHIPMSKYSSIRTEFAKQTGLVLPPGPLPTPDELPHQDIEVPRATLVLHNDGRLTRCM